MPTVSPWVRVTHLPTGLRANCHCRVNRSDPDVTRATALRILRARLWLRHCGVREPAELPVIREYALIPSPATFAVRKEHAVALARVLNSALRGWRH
jgi:hypothetical protein